MENRSVKIIGLTDISIRNILQNAGADALALYVAYYETAVYQGNYSVYATTDFMAKKMGWSKRKTQNVKSQLLDINIIADKIDRDNEGKIKKHYVVVYKNNIPKKKIKNTNKGTMCTSGGYVYLLKSDNLYKIGQTKNIVQRYKQIRSFNPNVVLLYSKFFEKHYKKEQELHKKYIKNHFYSEWFRLNEKELNELKIILQ